MNKCFCWPFNRKLILFSYKIARVNIEFISASWQPTERRNEFTSEAARKTRTSSSVVWLLRSTDWAEITNDIMRRLHSGGGSVLDGLPRLSATHGLLRSKAGSQNGGRKEGKVTKQEIANTGNNKDTEEPGVREEDQPITRRRTRFEMRKEAKQIFTLSRREMLWI